LFLKLSRHGNESHRKNKAYQCPSCIFVGFYLSLVFLFTRRLKNSTACFNLSILNSFYLL
jgi:hypothetical protein